MDLVTFLHIIVESGFAVFCLIALFYIRVYKEGPFGNVDVLKMAWALEEVIKLMKQLVERWR